MHKFVKSSNKIICITLETHFKQQKILCLKLCFILRPYLRPFSKTVVANSTKYIVCVTKICVEFLRLRKKINVYLKKPLHFNWNIFCFREYIILWWMCCDFCCYQSNRRSRNSLKDFKIFKFGLMPIIHLIPLTVRLMWNTNVGNRYLHTYICIYFEFIVVNKCYFYH